MEQQPGRYFLDSSKLNEITKWDETGLIRGVTTNQGIMVKDGIRPEELDSTVAMICARMDGRPVSVELLSSHSSVEDATQEGRGYKRLGSGIYIKVPLLPEDPLKTAMIVRALHREGLGVNITVLTSSRAMELAADIAGQCYPNLTFISLFWARSAEEYLRRKDPQYAERYTNALPLRGLDAFPAEIMRHTLSYLTASGLTHVRTIAGSIRDPLMVEEAIAAGTNFVTVTPGVFEQYIKTRAFTVRGQETVAEFDRAGEQLRLATRSPLAL